jgi:molecular chaperone HscC
MIFGIDLGTTNSLIGYFDDSQPKLIPNALGHVLTPSAVSVDAKGQIYVGLAARERLATDAANTAVGFKRWMGTDRVTRLGNRNFRPEELSALVLKSLKADAEAHAGQPVSEAVITVPAYFNDAQRKATKTAGELAGLRVERLLNEPTAAGLAYGLAERPDHTTFLVFDLGGGTFDVSVLEYFDGVVEVRASAGDTRLGGEDFTEAITKLILQAQPSIAHDMKQRTRPELALWRASEQIKRDLSDKASSTQEIAIDGGSVAVTITREQFDQATKDLIDRLRKPIERALLDAQVRVSDLAEVVLVGGATRMPTIRQLATRLFHRLPLRTIDPDETIARGATIQAALKANNKALSEIVLTDVMPYSLGVISSDMIDGQRIPNRFSPIIERNTPIPVSRSNQYHTVGHHQTHIDLDIRQGESPVGTDNLHLGKLEITVPPMPAGEAAIDVRFTYDANGLLVVDVKDLAGGKVANTVINQSANEMSESALREALQRMQAIKLHPREQQENIYLLERAKRLYADLLGDPRNQVQFLLSHFEVALDSQDEARIAASREQMRDGLKQLDPSFVL